MDKEEQYYHLDKRIMRNHAYYKNRRDHPSSDSFPRSSSSAELLGSQAEHFGYNRSLGASLGSQMSHAGKTFHDIRKQAALAPPAGATGRTVWDSTKPQASSATLASSMQRTESAPSTSRSVEAQAVSSRYRPKESLRKLGLASRTHSEWCLPAAPGYVPNS